MLVVTLVGGAYLFDAWNTNWAMTMVFAITIVLGVESFAISFHRHPKLWRLIRWGLILALLALLLIGAVQ